MFHFVYPYVKDFAQGNELRNSIRSICDNFIGDFKIFVIGDREDWMSGEINFIDFPRTSDNPPIDIANKMLKICSDSSINEDFIWMNDDIYFLSPVYIHDIQLLKTVGRLENSHIPSLKTIYQTNKKKTLDFLKSNEATTWDYSTHLPHYYNRRKLSKLIRDLKLNEESMLISSLYFNLHFPDQIPFKLNHRTDNIKIGVYRNNPDYEYLKESLKTKKFLNHSQTGFTSEVSLIVNELFKRKSKFEKI